MFPQTYGIPATRCRRRCLAGETSESHSVSALPGYVGIRTAFPDDLLVVSAFAHWRFNPKPQG
jgi:hypothetical protein